VFVAKVNRKKVDLSFLNTFENLFLVFCPLRDYMLVEELLIMAILYRGINKLWQTHANNIFYFYG
jgi:hypothetical protein